MSATLAAIFVLIPNKQGELKDKPEADVDFVCKHLK